MFAEVPLFPEQASTTAERVDALFFFLCAVTGIMAVLIALLLLYFAVRYRRRGEDDRTPRILGNNRLEWFWTIAPMFVFLIMFLWGASIYTSVAQPPPDAPEVFVIGKQWMWKIQHPDGQREINELHIPVGRPVKLTLTSEDVIHDFFVPAFRTKIDVMPGRYVHTWFQPTKTGPLPPVLLAVLRHQPRQHGRLGHRHGTRRNTRTGWTAMPRGRWRCKAASCSSNCSASPATAPTRRPALRCWKTCTAEPSTLRDGRTRRRRRRLSARVDPVSRGQGRAGLGADHADLQGPGQRGGTHPAARLHQVAAAGADAGAHRGLPAAARAPESPPGGNPKPPQAVPTNRPEGKSNQP